MDPRTPVLIGYGQVNQHDENPHVEPVDLMASAARTAADPRVLEALDSVRIVNLLSWHYRDPGLLLAQRLHAAQDVDLIGAAQMHGCHGGGRRGAVHGRGRRNDPLDPGDLCGDNAHMRRGNHGIAPARHIAADAVDRNVLVAEPDPW